MNKQLFSSVLIEHAVPHGCLQLPALHHLTCLPAIAAELAARACIVADLLLAEHLELLFGQHVSVAIACSIYFTVGWWACELCMCALELVLMCRTGSAT